MPTKCRHCKQRNACCSRELCKHCYRTSNIRDLYPPKTKNSSETVDCNRRSSLPEPTDTMLGTEARVKVLQERARLRQSLHHPQDAMLDDD